MYDTVYSAPSKALPGGSRSPPVRRHSEVDIFGLFGVQGVEDKNGVS